LREKMAILFGDGVEVVLMLIRVELKRLSVSDRKQDREAEG